MAKKKKAEKEELEQKADEILQLAQDSGVEDNFLFITTFKRYRVQLKILDDLEQAIKEDGTLVTKEYVKNRGNLYTHPAITEYNRTTTSANQTVSTLLKIIKNMGNGEESDESTDELLTLIGVNG